MLSSHCSGVWMFQRGVTVLSRPVIPGTAFRSSSYRFLNTDFQEAKLVHATIARIRTPAICGLTRSMSTGSPATLRYVDV